MRYISTRGASPPQSFDEILLSGLAPDGGLYMPDHWPQISRAEIAGFAGKSYADVAFAILKRFTGNSFSDTELKSDVDAAYAGFDAPEIAPLVAIAPEHFLLELFHGPTLAFKDIAMQVLGRMFTRALAKRGVRMTILAATSGDTGSAAIAAFAGLPNVHVFVIHPEGRVSDVQRRQMTTASATNIHNIALEGTFDDAQALVKALFADKEFARATSLTAVNSINFARIAAQCVYYFTATAKLESAATFVVPTGNFGDVFAGEAAMRMGLPVRKLIVATNANDIVARALNEGIYKSGIAVPTLSPSMDIQIASNFERALFEASGRNAKWIGDAMDEFARDGQLIIPPEILALLQERYEAGRADDAETLDTIASVFGETGRVIDPHTAVALAVARKAKSSGPVVVLSTAHAAKFPNAVVRAGGRKPPLPPQLKGLYDGVERYTILPNNPAELRSFIKDRSPL